MSYLILMEQIVFQEQFYLILVFNIPLQMIIVRYVLMEQQDKHVPLIVQFIQLILNYALTAIDFITPVIVKTIL